MQLINNVLYLSWAELEALGVDANTINLGCRRQRANGGQSWANIPDPKDGRRCLVRYDSIPAATYKGCGLPPLAEMLARYAAASAAEREQEVLAMLPPVLDRDMVALHAYRVMRLQVNPVTGEETHQDMGGLPEEKIAQYAIESRWLRLTQLPLWQNKADRLRLTGCATHGEAVAWLVDLAKRQGVKLPKTPKQLVAKHQAYVAAGAVALVSGSYGNRNREKVDEAMELVLASLASDRHKPSVKHVHQTLAAQVAKQPTLLQDVSYRTVARRLAQPALQQQVVLRRDGYQAHKARFGYTMKTRRPSFADALWNIDGTKLNLYYQTKYKGTTVAAARLNMVMVMDVYSGAMLGWYFGEREAEGIAPAMRMALERAGGILPHQVMYDQAGSNTAFFARYTGTHFAAMANNGQSKPIEREIGRFQDTILRGYDAYTGGNVTAKSVRSQVNRAQTSADAHIKIKPKDLPTREEAIAMGEKALRVWNHTKDEKTGLTRWEKYQAGKREGCRALTREDELAMFYTERERPVLYTKAGVTLQDGPNERYYEVYQCREAGVSIPDMDFHLRYSGHRFVVKEDVSDPGRPIALYRADDMGQLRFVAWAEAKAETARALVDYTDTTRAQVNAGLKAKKEQVQQLHSRAQEGQALMRDWGIVGPAWGSKDAEALAEAEALEEAWGAAGLAEQETTEAVAVPIERALDAPSANVWARLYDKQRANNL